MSSAGAGPGDVPDLSDLVRAAAGGDDDAFCALYAAVQPGLLRYLWAMVGQDAEDVASEAWLQIARDIHSYRGEGAGFRAWAASVARNRALDQLRRQSRRPAQTFGLEALHDLADGQDTAEQAAEAVSTAAAISLIATLPRDQAEAVLLRVVLGLDAEAAGQVLGKRAGAVRTAAHRGLRRLARQLDRQAAVPPPRPAPGLRTAGIELRRE
ncbi:MAG TPA: RNA polymerase sigma factor [Mycobacteriales bacterium]|nr:RNA polymerase sigma factor [Mycobacteriales bacterium]